jgi:pimeloyl-ACP methyl ester carboxylesterase
VLDRLRECIDYAESGAGPTIVLVPGSCSTGAAWKPVIASLNGRFRCVTTSLLGYGGTLERRTARDPSIAHETDVVEWVIRKAGGRVHLVGHSFGGLVALAVALRNEVDLASIVLLEPPAIELLRERNEDRHHAAIRRMKDTYFASFRAGNDEAISMMMDFYGGDGTFASWPPKVRAYAVKTTPVNMLDWASALGFPLSAGSLSRIGIPALLIDGSAGHPAMQRIDALLSECMSMAGRSTIRGAAHFMPMTHPDEVASLIAQHVDGAEAGRELALQSLESARLQEPLGLLQID